MQKAGEMIGKARQLGAEVVVLPEMFNCPYDNKYFPLYAEKEGGVFGRQCPGLPGQINLFGGRVHT